MSTTAARSGITATSPAFTQLVVKSMRELFPEELADRTWDNVGLLLDNVQTPNDPATPPVVLLTNDLTYAVAEEAISLGASVIISYHPIIFRGLKALTCADPQQATLLRLARAGVAVYCPHTALDASPYGINAWLAEIVELAAAQTADPAEAVSAAAPTRRVLKPASSPPEGLEGAGYGMETTLGREVPAARIIKGVGRLLGGLQHLHVAEPAGVDVASAKVSSVAVCAGSGADVMRGSGAEMWITGEMSHHDALAAAQRGRIVVTTYHSNTERQFLEKRLQGMLEERLRPEESRAEVLVSRIDSDPFRVVDLEAL
ncbi:related to Ngg1p-interacting factor 3 [Cephalotrichum gorgonifer]|uniref:Related to Ngg1p-interacting factor 3 n=1 Tax=Cephalotrichum gorgonifer TaxID=2041049 RepID=A0AAE8N1M9_9PEZI|nr:related to Ngg1p-interacting factor 3 [Cephalotrichum gorgonifer]